LAGGGSGSAKGWIRRGDFDLRIESTSDACLKGRTRTNGRRERCCGELGQLADAPAKLAILKYGDARMLPPMVKMTMGLRRKFCTIYFLPKNYIDSKIFAHFFNVKLKIFGTRRTPWNDSDKPMS
jgi:hypothetical protein